MKTSDESSRESVETHILLQKNARVEPKNMAKGYVQMSGQCELDNIVQEWITYS